MDNPLILQNYYTYYSRGVAIMHALYQMEEV